MYSYYYSTYQVSNQPETELRWIIYQYFCSKLANTDSFLAAHLDPADFMHTCIYVCQSLVSTFVATLQDLFGKQDEVEGFLMKQVLEFSSASSKLRILITNLNQSIYPSILSFVYLYNSTNSCLH